MERVGAIFVGLILLVVGLKMIPGNYNALRGHVGAKPLPPPEISLSYSPPMLPVRISINDTLTLDVQYDVPTGANASFYGFSVSPAPVRKLVIVLGDEAREYDIRGVIRIAIPNTLSGRNSIEWDGDVARIRIPDPKGVHFANGK